MRVGSLPRLWSRCRPGQEKGPWLAHPQAVALQLHLPIAAVFVNIVVRCSSITAGHLWVYLGKSVAAKDGMGENEKPEKRAGGWTSRTVWVLRSMSGDVWSLTVHQLQRRDISYLSRSLWTSRDPSNMIAERLNRRL